MLKNKILQWLIAGGYIVLFILMWMQSRQPSLRDVPILFIAGTITALLCLVFTRRKANQVLMIINIALLIANIVMYFAAYRLVSGALKN